MSQENVDLAKQGYDAFGRGDIETAFANFDDGIEWRGVSEDVPAGGTYSGRDAVSGEWLKNVGENFDEFTVSPEEFLDAGDHVVVTGQAHAKLKNGATVDGEFCHVWEYRNGKAVKARFWGDSAALLKATQG